MIRRPLVGPSAARYHAVVGSSTSRLDAPRAFAAAAAALALVLACSDEDGAAQPRERCAQCGMYVEASGAFTTGATTAAGQAVVFDSPKCLFRWLARDAGAGATGTWVTEYFTRERRPSDDVFYVLGSDVTGPMGRDLVPVAPRDRAEAFAASHGGRVLGRADIDAEVVEGLFR